MARKQKSKLISTDVGNADGLETEFMVIGLDKTVT